MHYREIPPSPKLSRYVESFWRLESGSKPDMVAREKILPDGCVELIFNLADPFRRFHANGEIEKQPRLLIAGQMRRFTGRTGQAHGKRSVPAPAGTLAK